MDPQIRYCTTADGVCIAYTVMGDGVPLVFASNIFGDVHWYIHNEGTRAQVDTLAAAGFCVVRYDMRGMGSSDRDVTDISVPAGVLDLEAVIDATGFDRFALCGYTHGCGAAIAYAASHAERLSHLILVNPYAVGEDYYEKIPTARAMRSLRSMALEDWKFFTLTIASAMFGHIDPVQAQRTSELFRASLAPEVYVAFTDEAAKANLLELLPRISTPTLVVIDRAGVGHADLAKSVASRVRHARLVTTDDYLRDLAAFLGLEPGPTPMSASQRQAAPQGGTAVILFTDIADSTVLTERMGDAAFRDASRALDVRIRAAVRSAGGTPVEGKVLGDGVMGIFASAAHAITTARACVAAADDAKLPLHIGIHAGDVISEGSNVYGGAVNIASRICGLCAPGDILVSQTVRDLARTSAGVTFKDRGEHELKGIADPVRIFAVQPP